MRGIVYLFGVAGLAMTGLSGSAAVAETQGQTFQFNIPAQRLDTALRAFARVTGKQVSYDGRLVRTRQGGALQGAFTSTEAMSRLLVGTQLRSRLGNSGVYIVEQADPQPGNVQAGDVPRSGRASAASIDATNAAANPPPEQPTDTNDIVVTALRRTDRLQNVPASVAAFSGQALQRAGAVSYRDYLNTIPSVSYVTNGSYKDKIFIRGISEGISARTLATTGIYIDETPITEVDASLADINTFDIDRVEVLRGPQGTLYGSGSMGGTVRIITTKPSLDKIGGLADATLSGTRYGGINYALNAAVNVPIVADKIGVRLTVGHSNNTGWIDNSVNGQTNINDSHTNSVRAQLRVKPTERLDLLASFQYQDAHFDYNPSQDIGQPPRTVARYAKDYNYFKTRIYSLTGTYDFGFATLLSATNVIDKSSLTQRDTTARFGGAFTALTGRAFQPGDGLGLLYKYPNKNSSEEVRLSSNGTGRFKWLVGAFYSRFYPLGVQTFNQDTATTAGIDFYTTSTKYNRRQLAAFGEATYTILPKLDLTAGYRRFSVKTHNITTSSGILNDGVTTVEDQRASENSGVQKYAATYHLTKDNLIYAQAAQGFRPGGPNDALPTQCSAELQASGYSGNSNQYKSDKLWDYELGTKNSLFDRKMTLNLTGYVIRWTDIQVTKNLDCGFQFIANLGRVENKGVELETSIRPLDGLELRGSLGYVRTKILTTNSAVGAVEGDQLPNVPKWQYSGSAQYSFNVAPGQIYIRGDLQHTGSRYNDFIGLGPSRAVDQPAYTLVNARVGLYMKRAELALFVTNLFDNEAVLNTIVTPNRYQDIATPRTVGVNAKYNF